MAHNSSDAIEDQAGAQVLLQRWIDPWHRHAIGYRAVSCRDPAHWRETVGREHYPGAQRLLIWADGGGSIGSRVRAWKVELAAFAAETGLKVAVAHLPPGTSKWNKIEHRLDERASAPRSWGCFVRRAGHGVRFVR